MEQMLNELRTENKHLRQRLLAKGTELFRYEHMTVDEFAQRKAAREREGASIEAWYRRTTGGRIDGGV